MVSAGGSRRSATLPSIHRITSYNVCYTKLLRGGDQIQALGICRGRIILLPPALIKPFLQIREAGVLSVTGTPETPSKVGISIADIATA